MRDRQVNRACLPTAARSRVPCFASLFLLRGSVVGPLSSLFVTRHEDGGLFQSVALFSVNALVAAFCEFAGISVGHSKDVVSLDSLVSARVAWDRFSKFKTLFFLFNSKEDIVCLIKRLSRWLSQINATWTVVVESCGVLLEMLFIYNCIILVCTSVEFSNRDWIDWLLQNKSSKI